MSEETKALAEALDRFSDKADKLLSNSNGGSATIHVNAGSIGLWIAVTAAIVSSVVGVILVVLFGVGFLYFAAQDNWAAQEVTALRSYIVNGKLKPMAPRPGFNESAPPNPEKSP